MPLCPYEAVHQYAILDIPHAVGQLEDSLRPVLHAAVFSLSASFEIRGFSAIRQRSCKYNILQHTTYGFSNGKHCSCDIRMCAL